MSKSLKSKFLTFFIALLFVAAFAFTAVTAMASTEPITIDDARASQAENIAAKDTLTASNNIRESWSNYDITFKNGTFTASQLGGWQRSAMVLNNKYLNAETVIKDGQEIAASAATTYITATLNYSATTDSKTAGVLFGKRAIEGGNRYYGLVVSPTQKVVFVYTFDVDGNGAWKEGAHAQGPVSYEAKEYAKDTDYKIEILMKPEGLDIYVGGNAIATNFTTVYETNESVVGLTPILGLSWCDISMTLSNLSLQYLDATVAEPVLTIDDARASQAENIAAKDTLTASNNIRESWSNYDITFKNGTFTASQLGGWQRSAMVLSNKYLNAETVIKDGQEIAASAATTYITATLNYSETTDSKTAGVLFGKRAIEGGNRYYGLVVSPTQKVVFVYHFDLNANGECVSEKQGPVSYEAKEYAKDTDYKIEILMKPTGLDIYVGGNVIATNFTTVYETNESVVGLTPILGLSWCDISMTLSNLSLQYLDATVAEPVLTIEDARKSKAENVAGKDTLTVSKNIREGWSDHDITFENGTFTASQLGGWQRSAMVLGNKFLNSEKAVKNGQEVATSEVTTYITATFNYSETTDSKTAGVLFGKRAIEGGTRYYGLVVSPTQKVVFVYQFDLNANGECVSEKQGPVSYDRKEYLANTDYKIEILMKPEGLDIYVGGNVIATNFTNVYETNESVVGLTPILGLSWCDISMTLSDISMKYLDAEAKAAVVKFTLEQARSSEAANLVNASELTASNNFREGSDYGIVFENGKFTTTKTDNWSRAAMRLKNRHLNSDTVIMNGEKVSSNMAAAYISVNLIFTETTEYKNIGTLIGRTENESSYTYYAVVVSFSQQIVFVYTFDTDMAGNVVADSEKQGPVSYNKVNVSYGEAYKLEVVLNPEVGMTVAWDGAVVCEDLTSVYESGKTLKGISPMVGLSWADMTGSADSFVLKYLNAEVVPGKEEIDDGPIDEPTYPEPGPAPDINTEIIIPDVNRPNGSADTINCSGFAGAQLLAAIPLLALFTRKIIKRRK